MIVELPQVNVTGDFIVAIAAILISLAASYIPNFREWFAQKTEAEKQLGMFISVTVVTLVIAALSFSGIWVLISPTKEGIILLILSWGAGLIANQTTYKYSPQVDSVKMIKNAQAYVENQRLSRLASDKASDAVFALHNANKAPNRK